MPTRDEFLRAIIAASADDGPRLVYADWLDEQGDCARAEFIRLQCELDRAPLEDDPVLRQDSMKGVRAYYAKLRRRERKLLLDNWKSFAPKLGANDSTFEVILSPNWSFRQTPAVEFRRGFVEVAHAYLADLNEAKVVADPLFAEHPIRELTPYGPPGGAGPRRSDHSDYLKLWMSPHIGRLRVLNLTRLFRPRHHYSFLAPAREVYRPWRGLQELWLPEPDTVSTTQNYESVRRQYARYVDPATRIGFVGRTSQPREAPIRGEQGH